MKPESLRGQFPLLSREDPPIYLDNACTTLKPRGVIEAVTRYYEETPFCAGRAVYEGSLAVEQSVERARGRLAHFLGGHASGTVFTKNATEAINLVAHSFPWRDGDVVLTTDREHNSNLVPWQMLAARGVRHEVVASKPDGTLDLDAFADRLARRDVRFVAAVHSSNLDGYQIPAKDLVDLAHDMGAKVLLDGAQAAPHSPVDLARIRCDYYAVSLHKMYGPTGVGALLATDASLATLSPFLVGGDTVARTTYHEEAEFLEGPSRFEAGIQNYAGLAAVPAAIDFMEQAGMEEVAAHERALARRIARGLEGAPDLQLVGAPIATRGGIVPFALESVDPHALAILLEDKHRIMVRSGDHCLHSWFNAHGVPGAVRASCAAYTTHDEADAFVGAVRALLATLTGSGA